MFLRDSFLAQYEGKRPPMTALGEFVYLRTYSRWLPEEGRRERWQETCRRVVEYSLGLEYKHREKKHLPLKLKQMRAEAEELYDAMFNLRQFPSGRTMWVGGTPIAEKFPLANFNCAFMVPQELEDFCDLFYLLLVGSGVGLRVLAEDMQGIPQVNAGVSMVSMAYQQLPAEQRLESTRVSRFGASVLVEVGDSKEGWVEALRAYLRAIQDFGVETVAMCYNSVRPKGERLKTFGGTASGHEGLVRMFEQVHRVVCASGGRLKPVDFLDIANLIGENVVSGGVRRTSEICISDDPEIENAKQGIYSQDAAGNWVTNMDLLHRRISNNSLWFTERPERERLHEILERIKTTGEPGFINAASAQARRADFAGVNPCGEILLASYQTCNLTTVNARAFVRDGAMDMPGLLTAMGESARIGLRMTLVEFELPKWRRVQLTAPTVIGCSLTGWQDMREAVGMDEEDEAMVLDALRFAAQEEARAYAAELGIKAPELVTTVKPEGTISQLPTVSSGLHYSHSPYFIRRVRISVNDPLFKAAQFMEFPMEPEVGQTWETADTAVLEFPIKSDAQRTKAEVSALEQLENYRRFMRNYVDHNASITVTVKDDEWGIVEQWLWDNWDTVVGMTFLPFYGGVYPLAPYEEITEAEYKRRKAAMPLFQRDVLDIFDNGHESEMDSQDSADCSTGACPIR